MTSATTHECYCNAVVLFLDKLLYVLVLGGAELLCMFLPGAAKLLCVILLGAVDSTPTSSAGAYRQAIPHLHHSPSAAAPCGQAAAVEKNRY